jgi:serine phosphatase RsbU (regulator of sigma subunit)
MAVLAAVGLALEDRSSMGATAARIAVIVVGTMVAARAASLRIRRQQDLLELSTVASAAQRAIIRKPAPQVGSVAVATWYQSSVRAATVGGDCYEILATPFGTRVILGDVRGHGMPSVRLAALVLGAFRALAYTEVDLADVARQLDLLVGRFARDTADGDVDGEEFVTAVLCEVDGFALTLANCGHPSPLLVTANGQVQRLDASVPACPLGIGTDPVLDTFEVPVGARVLLYTDGLIETADRSREYFDLEAAASGLAYAPLSAGVASVIDKLNAFADGHVDDDVALMLLEPLGAPTTSADAGTPT